MYTYLSLEIQFHQTQAPPARETDRVRGRRLAIGPVWRAGGGLGYPCHIYYSCII